MSEKAQFVSIRALKATGRSINKNSIINAPVNNGDGNMNKFQFRQVNPSLSPFEGELTLGGNIIFSIEAEKWHNPLFFRVFNSKTKEICGSIKVSDKGHTFETFLSENGYDLPVAKVIITNSTNDEDIVFRHYEYIGYSNKTSNENTVNNSCSQGKSRVLHHLFEKKPNVSADGTLTLNFEKKPTIPDEMNCIIKDQNEREVISLRKVANKLIEVLAEKEYYPMHIMTLAVGAYLYDPSIF